MWFVKLVNAVLCEMTFYFEALEAGEAYNACLRTAEEYPGMWECYAQLVADVSDSSAQYLSCLF